MSTKTLNLVVAMCNNRGIGVNGQLPWRIRGDMQFFKKISTSTETDGKQNAVIMGRKTWESIPQKFRPLPGRVNIVISREMKESPEGAYLARSLEDAIKISGSESLADSVEGLFIIGGASIYQMALESSHSIRIYLTKVLADINCDTFLPEFDMENYKMVEDPAVPSEVQTEKEMKYKFEVYEKIPCDQTRTAIPITKQSSCSRGQLSQDAMQFNIMAAMCSSRGIGLEGTIKWPSLKNDYRHYLTLTSQVSQPGSKSVNIKGRVTWEETGLEEKSHPDRMNIVISSTLKQCPEYVTYLAKDLNDALRYAVSPPGGEKVNQVWVMGGSAVYQTAVLSPYCRRIYLTRIFEEFTCDRFFPEFEHLYRKIRDASIDDSVQEENGVQYQFEVWEKIPEMESGDH